MPISLDQKQFVALSNSDNGSVSDETTFHYFQDGSMIWGNYSGGKILKGHLIGKFLPSNQLEFVYHHLEKGLEIRTGRCRSIVELNAAGKVVLHETWEWTNGDQSSGTSVLIEK